MMVTQLYTVEIVTGELSSTRQPEYDQKIVLTTESQLLIPTYTLLA